jgi:hypothetical protein
MTRLTFLEQMAQIISSCYCGFLHTRSEGKKKQKWVWFSECPRLYLFFQQFCHIVLLRGAKRWSKNRGLSKIKKPRGSQINVMSQRAFVLFSWRRVSSSYREVWPSKSEEVVKAAVRVDEHLEVDSDVAPPFLGNVDVEEGDQNDTQSFFFQPRLDVWTQTENSKTKQTGQYEKKWLTYWRMKWMTSYLVWKEAYKESTGAKKKKGGFWE